MKIHPTAVVDPKAQLGADVEIGAFAIVGPNAVIGANTIVQAHAVVEGTVRLGERNLIGYGAIIGGPPQDLSFKPDVHSEVQIGNENIIREYCTIHRGTSEGTATVVGDRNFLMAGVHVAHNCRIGNRVIIANNCLLAGHVQIDDGAFAGGGTSFHQHVRVGRLSMAQGDSGFAKDIPPFVLAGDRTFAVGVNVLGMRRAGFAPAERNEVRRAFRLLYRSGLNTQQALAKAAASDLGPAAREFFAFIAQAKKRGIIAHRYNRARDPYSNTAN